MSHPSYNALVRETFEWWLSPSRIDWSDVNKSKRLSTASSAKVTAEIESGRNYGKLHGISKKSDQRLASVPHGGAYSLAVARKREDWRTDSDTEKLRAALRAGGPMSCAELAAKTRIPVLNVPGLLKYDRKCDRIALIRDARPYRYEWVAPAGTEATA